MIGRCVYGSSTALFLLFFLTHVVIAAEAADIRRISAPEVKNLVETDQALLIHVLSEIEFEFQHIPKSINIPIIKMASTNLLPLDKNRPLIFYCMGER
ncbi:MAG: rhodanese-like domain-containing protein [Desulfobacteraceae bacterium]|nr:rhodanese-like domain-containing protein [Desulfobacteraceae bacterium]